MGASFVPMSIGYSTLSYPGHWNRAQSLQSIEGVKAYSDDELEYLVNGREHDFFGISQIVSTTIKTFLQ